MAEAECEHELSELDCALARVKEVFVKQTIYRDASCRPTAFFSATDFLSPLAPSLIDDMAMCIADLVPFYEADAIVSVANRSSGPLTHAVAQHSGLSYTLSNWYPPGSPGEIEVEKCPGFSGDGVVYLNGLQKQHKKVIILMDVLRTGASAQGLVRAVTLHGASVVHCVFGCEIVEYNGRNCDEFAEIPVTSLVQVHMRGECTKEVKGGGDLPMPTSTVPRPLTSLVRIIKKMDPALIAEKLDRVSRSFLNIPIIRNEKLSYPYCYLQLTDYVPLMPASLVEEMADLCVYLGDFERADLLVSEADRGGGPLVQAIGMRTGLPYVVANWYAAGEGIGASSVANVAFSGSGQIVVNGVKKNDRVIFVDDMLSSGGTAVGVLESVMKLGGIPLEGVFVSEKLYPPPEGKRIPVRKGMKHLQKMFPHFEVTTVVQFSVIGERTSAPTARVG